jgi:hypothetical protein
VSSPAGRTWVPGEPFPYSRKQVNRAGDRIRRAASFGATPTPDDLLLLDLWRASHQGAHSDLQAGLRRLFHEVLRLPQTEFVIGGRPLKTTDAITKKLVRSKTRLATMQDIAGTRIVVPSLSHQQRFLNAVLVVFERQSAEIAKDSVDRADETGYRAIHVVVSLPDSIIGARLAEIQIRTPTQDVWAQIVEELDESQGWDLKHGDGPAEWMAWLHALSDAFEKRERGEPAVLPDAPNAVSQ